MKLMTYKYLETRCDAAVEYLTLNRPDVRNAFNAEMIAEITNWAESVAARAAGLRAVVIAGAGKAFCAGGDAAWMARTITYTEVENLQDARALSGMFRAIDHLPLPVIGRVQGAAMGGGAGLAAVCDIVVAAQDATFAFSEVKLGLIPAVISSFVLHKIGRSAARELFLTGARFPASRAYEIGLVHAVVPAADLDDAVARYVAELSTGGPEAIAAAKRLIEDVAGLAPHDAAALTANAIATRRTSAEGQEGLKAFLGKRPPRWSR
jgi:methylglutaconyl-CoA hydratase